MSWKRTESLLFLSHDSYEPTDCIKIAGFDIDGTVIRTKSGKTFAVDTVNDWELWCSSVKEKLNSLVALQYTIVFFTNQGGILKGKLTEEDFQTKIYHVTERLGITRHVTVVASLRNDVYRKPHTGMWQFVCETVLSGQHVDPSASFYVGDAAGRPKRGKRKRDFSACDIQFAHNLDLMFHTPDAFFLGADDNDTSIGFNPKDYWKEHYSNGYTETQPIHLLTTQIHLVLQSAMRQILLLVASPASGKSTLAESICASYSQFIVVNQDTLHTRHNCIKQCRIAISQDKSVVVDNTNRDAKTRQFYIALAQQLGVPCNCIWINTHKNEVFHLNAFRNVTQQRHLQNVAIHSYFKYAEPPNTTEGITTIVQQPFLPIRFESAEDWNHFYNCLVL